jgi:hypothetical protein
MLEQMQALGLVGMATAYRQLAEQDHTAVQWARSDDIAGAQDHNRLVATGVGDARHLPMARGDTALMAALQHRNGASGRILRCGFSSAKASLTTRWVVACRRGLATVSRNA